MCYQSLLLGTRRLHISDTGISRRRIVWCHPSWWHLQEITRSGSFIDYSWHGSCEGFTQSDQACYCRQWRGLMVQDYIRSYQWHKEQRHQEGNGSAPLPEAKVHTIHPRECGKHRRDLQSPQGCEWSRRHWWPEALPPTRETGAWCKD